MIARTTRERHGGGRNIIERIEYEIAIPGVTPSFVAENRGGANG